MRNKLIALFLSVAVISAVIPSGIITATAQTAKIIINEVCSSNKGQNGNLVRYTDKNGEYCDWIEIYNTTDSPVDLSGYGVSDKKSVPFKSTLASGTVIGAKSYLVIYCSTDFIEKGTAVFALINISSDGENVLITPPGTTNSEIVKVPSLETDTTYGRMPDITGDFRVLSPTPFKSNNTAKQVLDPPIFSNDSGFYEKAFDLRVTAKNALDKIYYTCDGSDPKTSASRMLYTGYITIKDRTGEKNRLSAVDPATFSPGSKIKAPADSAVDKATVMRFYVADKNGNQSKTVTKTYFVGKNVCSYGNIKTLSVTTAYENLFDYNKGIYTSGKVYDDFLVENPGVTEGWLIKANFNQRGKDWVRDCNIELFDTDGSSILSQDCGLSIQGGASRANVQKSFRFTAKSEYGKSRFKLPLFGDSGCKEYKSFVVRDGGNSVSYLKFCDNFIQTTVSDRGFQTQKGQPCIVFLDGEFWGIYVMQEDYSPELFETSYGVNADDVVMIQGGWELEEGTKDDLNDFYSVSNFISQSDMTNSQNYEKAASLLDLEGFLNYMASEIYINNVDWPGGNWRIWKTSKIDEDCKYADGKWRMLMYDTEYSMWLYGIDKTKANVDSFAAVEKSKNAIATMFVSLMKNNEFCQRFYTAFCDIANNNFAPEATTPVLRDMYSFYLQYLLKNYERFSLGNQNEFKKRYSQLITYLGDRRKYALEYLESHFKKGGTQHKLIISSNINKAGTLALNSTTLDLTKYESGFFDGKYFENYAVKITAQPKRGYIFKGFTVGNSEFTDKTLELTLTSDLNICANYEKILIFGDVNDDLSVDIKDVLVLRKYLAGQSVEIYLPAADVADSDGVNTKELLNIRKYLAEIIEKL